MDATEAAVLFAQALQSAGLPHAVGGAIAYGFFGVPRGTFDVDLNIFVDGASADTAVDALIAVGLEIDRALALSTAVERGDARGRFQGMPVDLFFNSIPAHEVAASRTVPVTLHGVTVRVLSPEDTAIFKMLFFRGKDITDVERLLGMMGTRLDLDDVRSTLVATVGVDDHRVAKWDELVAKLAP